MSDPNELPTSLNSDRPKLHTFTMHLEFLAANMQRAREQAAIYAEGLNVLRGEVGRYSVRTSPGADWTTGLAVFCGAPGPNPGDVCREVTEHRGRHHGPEATGSWTEDDVPRAPATIEGLDGSPAPDEGGEGFTVAYDK